MKDSESIDKKENKIHEIPSVEDYRQYLKDQQHKVHKLPHVTKVQIPEQFHEGHEKCIPKISPEEKYGKEQFENTKHILEDHFGGACPIHQQEQKNESFWDKTKSLFSNGYNKVKKFFTS